MKINVKEIPSCTWELDGDAFFCTHDEREVVEYEEDQISFYGHYTTEREVYVCAECGEPLEGSPAEDRYDPDCKYEESREH